MQIEIYATYGELNAELERDGNPVRLSNDTHNEDPACIVVVYKWKWEGMGEEGPDLSFIRLEQVGYVALADKWDAFIYQFNDRG